ncbi:phospholipase A [Marinomonas spartinae]|uniref:phospholipase A n=1 Tax=Marinomonas spartinae TaxID=1792290 RepID=UPI0018F1BA5E|nr:phospholipase A [Marinomonas spartinae]MBJ7555686.1 phospholipase A [Marinomonas spartinae]
MKWLLVLILFSPSLLWATESKALTDQSSVNAKSDTSDDSTPEEPAVPEPISERAKKAHGLIQQRMEQEQATANNPFVLTPYKTNYFLPFNYNPHPVSRAFLGDKNSSDDLNDVEFKFQFSFKVPVLYDVVGKNSSLWVAYTQLSYWQAYNSSISAPFRDTNYEPEMFLMTEPKKGLFGIKPTYVSYGIVHQSNGQSTALSRSWNRIYVNFLFQTENTVYSIKPWYRIPENAADDDNPDIEKYLGYGELTMVHTIDDYTFDMTLRNNLRTSGNKGSVQLGFTFPLWGKSRGYIQYFNGYGDSLLDYNHSSQTLGVGIMLSSWL